MREYDPCIVIPVYNHARRFMDMVIKLLDCQLPIIVINDGSNGADREILCDLASKQPLVEVLHFKNNSGKGAAVIAGLRQAKHQGFTHALQIDADGQHDVNDVGKFLALSKEQPDCVICGCPVYDESVSVLRKFARYITHFWVWVETISFSIKDSMCGFRVYPLSAAGEVLDRYRIGKRMDFDTEILVKLYWDNVMIISVPTLVKYPVNGLSNFRLLKDNFLITYMHIRLFFGMLIRFPGLIRRGDGKKGSQHWATITERGTSLGLKLMFWVYRHLGRRWFLLALHPVTLYFFVTAVTARRASKQYLERLADATEQSPVIGFRKRYKHFYEFGVSAIDKIASWSGDIRRDNVMIHNKENFNEIITSDRGAVFIGSHLGNLELSRALGEQGGRFRINAVVFDKNSLKFQNVLHNSAPEAGVNQIHVESMGIDTAILLKQKVDAGEIIIIVGDRVPVNNAGRVRYVDFLGKQAPFAEGPFILASILGCPVYLIFCIMEKGVYNVYLEHFAQTLKIPRTDRRQRLTEIIQKYADRLAYYCAKSPLQWFNFYDFWCDADPDITDCDQLSEKDLHKKSGPLLKEINNE